MMFLFSFLHNLVGYPPTYQGSDTWEGWGPIDKMMGSIGLIIMAVGMLFLIMSLKRKEGKPKDEGFDPTHPKGYNE